MKPGPSAGPLGAEFPKVTVAVPLFRSGRVLSLVTETLRTLEYPNLEFLVSDRHCEDDALDRLQSIFGHDSRFRFLRAADKIDWVEHYNLLLREATGEYFLWVSHDDSYPPDYVAKLARALEEHPGAIVSYGRVERIHLDGTPAKYVTRRLPPNGPPAGPMRAYRVVVSAGLQFHGLFRRRMLLERELWIRPTDGTAFADVMWLLAVSLLGCFVFFPVCLWSMRYFPNSTHKLTPVGLPQFRSIARVTISYLNDFADTPFQAFAGKALVYGACSLGAAKLGARVVAEKLGMLPWIEQMLGRG